MNYFMIILVIAVLAIIGNIYQYTTKNNICKASLSGFHSCICSDVGIDGTIPRRNEKITFGVHDGSNLVYTKGEFR